MPSEPDPVFSNPRLAELYDLFDGQRDDLDLYEDIAEELGATRVLDVGCGTGALAVRLSRRGLDVVGVDPARASIDVARRKQGAADVEWIVGEATAVSDQTAAAGFDLAVSTGNVVQAIDDESAWTATLDAVARVVRPGGHFVFETRIPQRRAWEGWTPDASRQVGATPDGQRVECWNDVVSVDLPLVTFDTTFVFPDERVVSTSVLRFRTMDDITADLDRAGFVVRSVRDAPDRPGREWVFVAERAENSVSD